MKRPAAPNEVIARGLECAVFDSWIFSFFAFDSIPIENRFASSPIIYKVFA